MNNITIPAEIQKIIIDRVHAVVNNPRVQAVMLRMKHDGMTDETIKQLVIQTAIASLYGNGAK